MRTASSLILALALALTLPVATAIVGPAPPAGAQSLALGAPPGEVPRFVWWFGTPVVNDTGVVDDHAAPDTNAKLNLGFRQDDITGDASTRTYLLRVSSPDVTSLNVSFPPLTLPHTRPAPPETYHYLNVSLRLTNTTPPRVNITLHVDAIAHDGNATTPLASEEGTTVVLASAAPAPTARTPAPAAWALVAALAGAAVLRRRGI